MPYLGELVKLPPSLYEKPVTTYMPSVSPFNKVVAFRLTTT